MSELSLLFKGELAHSLRRNSKKAGEMTVAALQTYQTWILLILAINATTTIGSVLSHDFPGKTIFALVWRVWRGAGHRHPEQRTRRHHAPPGAGGSFASPSASQRYPVWLARGAGSKLKR
jgi:hypothetical protein